jgi:hypothetical protein
VKRRVRPTSSLRLCSDSSGITEGFSTAAVQYRRACHRAPPRAQRSSPATRVLPHGGIARNARRLRKPVRPMHAGHSPRGDQARKRPAGTW